MCMCDSLFNRKLCITQAAPQNNGILPTHKFTSYKVVVFWNLKLDYHWSTNESLSIILHNCHSERWSLSLMETQNPREVVHLSLGGLRSCHLLPPSLPYSLASSSSKKVRIPESFLLPGFPNRSCLRAARVLALLHRTLKTMEMAMEEAFNLGNFQWPMACT